MSIDPWNWNPTCYLMRIKEISVFDLFVLICTAGVQSVTLHPDYAESAPEDPASNLIAARLP
jgi:hypothetical protein